MVDFRRFFFITEYKLEKGITFLWLGIIRADENDTQSKTGWVTCEEKTPVEWTNWDSVSYQRNQNFTFIFRVNQMNRGKQYFYEWKMKMERGSMLQTFGQVRIFV